MGRLPCLDTLKVDKIDPNDDTLRIVTKVCGIIKFLTESRSVIWWRLFLDEDERRRVDMNWRQ